MSGKVDLFNSSLKQLTKQPRTDWMWDEWEELSSSSPPFLTVNVFFLFMCVCSCVIKEFLLVLYALRMWCDVTYKKIMFCCFVVATVVMMMMMTMMLLRTNLFDDDAIYIRCLCSFRWRWWWTVEFPFLSWILS